MPTPTKADLEAAVKRLAEENAAMRACLEQIRDAADAEKTAPLANGMDYRNLSAESRRRASVMIGIQSAANCALEYGHHHAELIANVLDKPLEYEPFVTKAEAEAAETSAAGPKMCPELSDAASFCARLDGHKMPHRDGQNYEWGEDEEPVSAADAIARLNPSAREVAESHRAAKAAAAADLSGTPFPDRPGYVTGRCGHAVAASEWKAGFRVCERCPTDANIYAAQAKGARS